ncbi:MAG: hypothetical protein ABII74_08225 [Elusimicrobiota bacterium]
MLVLFYLGIFAVAMGYLEAVVVFYLRQIFPFFQFSPVDIQPLLTSPLYFIEQTRETATIVMLVFLALLAGKTIRQRLAHFLWCFGIWDIFYYLGLFILLRWPSSLLTLDVLFLIPLPWIAPVIVPVSVSLVMIAWSIYLLVPKR